MQNIPTKATGSSLTAAEFNQIPDELGNAITSSGQTLSGSDLFQVAKSMAAYSSVGDYYTDSGIADAYVLNPVASMQGASSYTDGMRVRFTVGNSNTGASTINVNGLGVKSIVDIDGTALNAGKLGVGLTVNCTYDGTSFVLNDDGRNKSVMVNVADFGAVLNGISDDSVAWETALATGAIVTMPAGSTSYVNSEVILSGLSSGGISVDHSSTILLGEAGAFTFNNCTKMEFFGMKVDKTSIGTVISHFFGFTTCMDIIVDDAHVTSGTNPTGFNHAVFATYATTQNFTLQNSYVEYTTLGFESKAYVEQTIKNNKFVCVGSVGAMEAIKHNEGDHATVSGNIVYILGSGTNACAGITFESNSHRANVFGNFIEMRNSVAVLFGIRFANTYGTVSSNHTVHGNVIRTYSGSEEALHIAGGTGHKFTDNIIYGIMNLTYPENTGAAALKYVISGNSFSASPTVPNINITNSANLVISNNTFEGASTYGIYKDSIGGTQGDTLHIIGNTFREDYSVSNIYAQKSANVIVANNVMSTSTGSYTIDLRNGGGSIYNNVIEGANATYHAIYVAGSLTPIVTSGNVTPEFEGNRIETGTSKHDVVQTISASTPASGYHAKGEIVWNTGVVAGGTVGWVCTAAGTPGTWKAFGTVAA